MTWCFDHVLFVSSKMSTDPEKAMDVVNNDHSEEEVEDSDDEGNNKLTANVTSQLLKNPAVMAALQGKLDGMVGTPSGYIQVSMKN